MNTNRLPEELALDLTSRSGHSYQMAAVLVDAHGRIFSWGWNHLDIRRRENVYSVHAEMHAIQRANRKRLLGSTLFVAGKNPSSNVIIARPCDACESLALKRGVVKIRYSTPEGWRNLA